MKYPKLRELKEAITSLVTKPYTSNFPVKPHEPAEGFRGKPLVNEEGCVGCETCANICPSIAITISDDKENKIRTITRDYGACIYCGKCEEHCLTGDGVALSQKFDLACFDRSTLIETQERELLTCKSCGVIITTKDHYKYINEKLGPQAYSSVMNLNMLNERLELHRKKDVNTDVKDGLKRKDMFNILCPNCMRETQLKNLL
jgi:formate hydrogenlyase subunit 6/NADH:ubiquinone oxidoreductase subunit I